MPAFCALGLNSNELFRLAFCIIICFRIDESNKIKDMRVLAKMLEDGELHLIWRVHQWCSIILVLYYYPVQPSRRFGRLSIMTQRSSRLTPAVLSIKGLDTNSMTTEFMNPFLIYCNINCNTSDMSLQGGQYPWLGIGLVASMGEGTQVSV